MNNGMYGNLGAAMNSSTSPSNPNNNVQVPDAFTETVMYQSTQGTPNTEPVEVSRATGEFMEAMGAGHVLNENPTTSEHTVPSSATSNGTVSSNSVSQNSVSSSNMSSSGNVTPSTNEAMAGAAAAMNGGGTTADISVEYNYLNSIMKQTDTVRNAMLEQRSKGSQAIAGLRNEKLLWTEYTGQALEEVERELNNAGKMIEYLDTFRDALRKYMDNMMASDVVAK